MRCIGAWEGCAKKELDCISRLQRRRWKIVQAFNHGYMKIRKARRLVAAINRKIEEVYNGEEKQDRRI